MLSLTTKIAGIELPGFICNAAGARDTTWNELKVIAESQSAAVVMKSCTVEPRVGNSEPRFAERPLGTLQSMGLPNLGCRQYIEFAAELKKYHKPIIASVAGLCQEDYVELVAAFQASEIDLLEINLSCPNIVGKPQVGYDFAQIDRVLAKVSRFRDKPLGVKLPAYFDKSQQETVAGLIRKYKIDFITCVNALGSSLFIDPERETPLIKPQGGLGGLGGEYIKPIALGNVRAFYKLLGREVAIFGVGGVTSGQDAFEFLLAGADAVQVASTFTQEGPNCFARLQRELLDIMQRKGYNTINKVKGKLREL